MKAIRYYRYGPPEELRCEDCPPPRRRRGELLIRVQASSVNPKDCLLRKGHMRWLSPGGFPKGLGSDFAGIVEEGNEEFPAHTGVYGMLPFWRAGAYASWLSVRPEHVARVPNALSWQEAAALPLVGLTALQALRDLAKLQTGQHVLIHGASGGVGTVAIQIAKILGAQVTATCSAANAAFCLELGADRVLDYRAPDFLQHNERCDVFFDVFGNRPFPLAKRLLKKGGSHISTIPRPRNFGYAAQTAFSATRIRVVVVQANGADMTQLSLWVDEGKLKPVLDRVYPLSDAAAAHRYVETKRSKGKVVLSLADVGG